MSTSLWSSVQGASWSQLGMALVNCYCFPLLFFPPSSRPLNSSFFGGQLAYQILTVRPRTRAWITGSRKICQFRRISSFISETVRERPMIRATLLLSVLTAIFPGEPGLAGFIGAKDDGGGGDNWSCKTCKAPVKSSQPTSNFLQAGWLSCRPTNICLLWIRPTNRKYPIGPFREVGILGQKFETTLRMFMPFDVHKCWRAICLR